LRLAVGEVATRDYLRRELEEVREMLAKMQPPKQKGPKGEGSERRNKKSGHEGQREEGRPEEGRPEDPATKITE
jgi:hypothetical protein